MALHKTSLNVYGDMPNPRPLTADYNFISDDHSGQWVSAHLLNQSSVSGLATLAFVLTSTPDKICLTATSILRLLVMFYFRHPPSVDSLLAIPCLWYADTFLY